MQFLHARGHARNLKLILIFNIWVKKRSLHRILQLFVGSWVRVLRYACNVIILEFWSDFSKNAQNWRSIFWWGQVFGRKRPIIRLLAGLFLHWWGAIRWHKVSFVEYFFTSSRKLVISHAQHFKMNLFRKFTSFTVHWSIALTCPCRWVFTCFLAFVRPECAINICVGLAFGNEPSAWVVDTCWPLSFHWIQRCQKSRHFVNKFQFNTPIFD